MKQKLSAIAVAVIRDAIRRKVVWVVVFFAVLLSFVAPSLPTYGVGVVSAVYREIAIALMFAAALVVTLALAAMRIPGEVERRTVFGVLARDVARWHYVTGTWLGLSGVIGVAVLAFTVIAQVVGFVVYRELMWVLLAASLAVWLEMCVVAAVTVLLSTRFGAVTNSVGALTFLFVGHSVGILAAPGESLPWYVPSLDVFDVVGAVAHGSGYSLTYSLAMLGSFAAMSGLSLFAASALFGNRDL